MTNFLLWTANGKWMLRELGLELLLPMSLGLVIIWRISGYVAQNLSLGDTNLHCTLSVEVIVFF